MRLFYETTTTLEIVKANFSDRNKMVNSILVRIHLNFQKMQKHKVSDFWPYTEQNKSTDLFQLNTAASKRQLAFVYILSVVFFWWW